MRRTAIFSIFLFIGLGVLFIQACREQDNQKKILPVPKAKPADLGSVSALPLSYASPADNPITEEKVELGRLLFYDPILSGNKDVSCASCHHPEFGYAESLELPIGVNGRGFGSERHFVQPNDIPFSKRNAPALVNTAFNGIDVNGNYMPEEAPMFWDSRVNSLEVQALQPIKQLEEMRGRHIGEHDILQVVVKRLKAIPEYKRLFKVAFNEEEEAITETNLGKALASFQRSLVANNSRFDEFMRGNPAALTQSEKEGMQLFMESGCARCHNGPMLSDFKPHVLGVADNEKLGIIDSGVNNSFAFRTPTLRNLRFSAPYMHSGKLKTLEQVLTFYEDLHGKALPNANIKKEQLDTLAIQTRVAFKNIPRIVEFLNTLNDDKYDRKIPDAVPSGLSVGGNIK
ncbi:MAG TPA: cytochrome c peroxidase [Agriterribacter sp.]|uniref:cytochrome c peroxidase n=1 Tax=Agriterribacter sp. TaxID=2821509 RepID=UPI002C8D5D34|nr:cytochrome c peroxidase [Agriterribacter sp.]HRQ18347.1 cytochrome c peroxidase [Agriterribacter sp.]